MLQALFGTRTAADINLAAQLLLLAGLLVGFSLARRKRFDRHANVQTAMVLLNLVLIAAVMVPSFYAYVIAGGTTTGLVSQLMIGHGILGIITQVFALYLVLRMRTKLIPEQLRLRNIKLAMRVTLAVWTVLVLLGLGIYVERFLNQRAVVTAPLLQLRQLGADLYVHAVELDDANARNSEAAIKRHAEHLINLIEGKDGLHYGDNDIDGHLEDPGDGVGLLARLDTVAAAANDPAVTAAVDEVHGLLGQIVTLSLGLLGPVGAETSASVAEIVELASQANTKGVFAIDRAARTAGVEEAPALATAAGSDGSVTIHEDRFLFIPFDVTIPAGTTIVWVNDERAKHTATADDDSFDSGDQSLGNRFAHTFAEPGVYPYYCRYHGDVGGVGMAGTITVE